MWGKTKTSHQNRYFYVLQGGFIRKSLVSRRKTAGDAMAIRLRRENKTFLQCLNLVKCASKIMGAGNKSAEACLSDFESNIHPFLCGYCLRLKNCVVPRMKAGISTCFAAQEPTSLRNQTTRAAARRCKEGFPWLCSSPHTNRQLYDYPARDS